MANSQLSSVSPSLKKRSITPPRPILLDGEYEAVLKGWYLSKMPGMKNSQHKACLHWELINKYDEHEQPIIVRQFYNVNVLKNDQMEAGWSSDFIRDYSAVFQGYPSKTKGVNPDVYADCIVRLRLRTVTKTRNGKSLEGAARHSVVDTLLALVAGGGK